MGNYIYRLSLWFGHPDADLSEIPSRLGLSANRVWKKGDPRTAPNGRIIGGVYHDSRGSIEFVGGKKSDLPKGLRAAIAALKPHKAFLNELSETGTKFSFFVGWFSDLNSRDVIDWEILRDLAELRISLDLDVYGPDGDGDVLLDPA